MTNEFDENLKIVEELKKNISKISYVKEILDSSTSQEDKNSLLIAGSALIDSIIQSTESNLNKLKNSLNYQSIFNIDAGGNNVPFSISYDDILKTNLYDDWEQHYYPEEYKESKEKKQTWKVSVETEYFVKLPDDLLSSLGWKENDELRFVDNGDGSFSVTKVDNEFVHMEDC